MNEYTKFVMITCNNSFRISSLALMQMWKQLKHFSSFLSGCLTDLKPQSQLVVEKKIG